MQTRSVNLHLLVAEGNRRVAAEMSNFTLHTGDLPNVLIHTSECPHCKNWGKGYVFSHKDSNLTLTCPKCAKRYTIKSEICIYIYYSTLDIKKALRSFLDIANSNKTECFAEPHLPAIVKPKIEELIESEPNQLTVMASIATYLSPIGLNAFYQMMKLI